MGRKKNLKDLEPEIMELIDNKMNNGVDERYNTYTNCSKVLDYKVVLKCKNKKQKEYHNLIKEKDVILCAGEPGTGKSYVALATALELLDADFYTIEKILNSSGNNGKEILNKLIKCDIIVGEPIGYMRGKTLDNSIVLITEAENFNKQELFLILSRIGENSKYIINGDVKQLDRKDIKKEKQACGLEYAMEKLTDMPEIGTIHFTQEDIVRNPLISKIMDRWFEKQT